MSLPPHARACRIDQPAYRRPLERLRGAALATGTFIGALGLLVSPGVRAAGTVTVNVDPAAAQQLMLNVPEIQAQLQSALNEAYQVANGSQYVRNFGDSFAFTTKGLGVDYASNPQLFVVGIAGNVSLNVQDGFVPQNTKTAPPINAVGLNATLMGGLNFGFLGFSPLTIYGNYYQCSATINDHHADLKNWGVHAQVKVFNPGGLLGRGSPLRWGGVDVTTGLDYSQMVLRLTSGTINSTVPLGTSQVPDLSVIASSMGTFNLDLRTYSIPLEVTTNLRLLYILSLYGGLGLDLQVGGGNDMVLALNGTLTGRAPSQGITAQPLGTVSMAATDHQGPSVGHLRGLVGAQISILVVKLFAQLNWMPDKNLAGLAFGARVAW